MHPLLAVAVRAPAAYHEADRTDNFGSGLIGQQ
jgi:hypothetical protein